MAMGAVARVQILTCLHRNAQEELPSDRDCPKSPWLEEPDGGVNIPRKNWWRRRVWKVFAGNGELDCAPIHQDVDGMIFAVPERGRVQDPETRSENQTVSHLTDSR